MVGANSTITRDVPLRVTQSHVPMTQSGRMSLAGRTLNRTTCFTIGAGIAYAFANPDSDNVYDVFPLISSKYAFINFYEVPHEDRFSFYYRWRKIAKFFQNETGYLFTRLLKCQDTNSVYPFIEITQWSTGNAFTRALNKVRNEAIVERIPMKNLYNPLLYKVVVDDTEFCPTERWRGVKS